MPKLQVVQISELELEDYIVRNPNVIEEGFKILARQWPTDSGPLDILGVDADGIITIIELKTEEDDEQIIQGLRYYDFISTNIVALAKHFSSDKLSISDEDTRLILIAPSFSFTLKRICKYLDVELELKEYRAYKLPSGEIEVILNTVEIEEVKRLRIYPTLEQKLEMIQDEGMRSLANKFLKELESLGFEKRMVHDEWISLRYGGKRIAVLGCKKKFFVIETETEEGWKRLRIESQADYDKILNLLKKKIEKEQ